MGRENHTRRVSLFLPQDIPFLQECSQAPQVWSGYQDPDLTIKRLPLLGVALFGEGSTAAACVRFRTVTRPLQLSEGKKESSSLISFGLVQSWLQISQEKI